MRRFLPLALLILIPALAGCGGGDGSSSVSQRVPASGGSVSFGKAVTVQFPPGAIPDGTKVTITKDGAPRDELEGGQSLGSAFNIDLDGQTLSKPITLEIAFDPHKLPEEISPEQAFLGYYDQATKTWVPAGGTVDVDRNVITIRTDHLSWWNPFSWNWEAWLAVLEQTLSLRLSDWLDAVELLTTECVRSSEHASIDESRANNVIQGCITRDDPSNPEFMVVNIKSFFVAVSSPSGGGTESLRPTILGPGETVKFSVDAGVDSPEVYYADFTEEAMWLFIAGLVAQMLPAGDEAPNAAIAFFADGLPRVVNATEVIEAWRAKDAAGLADAIYELLTSDAFIEALANLAAQYSTEHGGDMLARWTASGIRQVFLGVAAVNVTVSLADFAANYAFNNRSEVAFNWTRVGRGGRTLIRASLGEPVTSGMFELTVTSVEPMGDLLRVHLSVRNVSGGPVALGSGALYSLYVRGDIGNQQGQTLGLFCDMNPDDGLPPSAVMTCAVDLGLQGAADVDLDSIVFFDSQANNQVEFSLP